MPAAQSATMYDTAANRPTAGIAGCWFYATDTNVWSRDNGASWDDCPEDIAAASIVSGTIGTVRLGSGTPSSSNFLR